jgi:hypothetical protein
MVCVTRPSRVLLPALLVLATAVPAAAWADPPVPVDPSQGQTDTFHFEIDQQMQVSGAAVGDPAQTTVTMSFDAQQTVSSLDESGTAQLEQHLQNVAIALHVNDEDVPTDDLTRLLTGLAMTFQMTSRGVIEDNEVSQVSDPQFSQMLDMLQESMRHVTVEFPEGPVAIGDSWTQDFPLQLDQPGMQLTTAVTARYTFLGYAQVDTHTSAVLQTDVQVTLSGTFDEMGIPTSVQGSGTGSGYTYFDNDAGTLLTGSMDLNLSTQITAEGIDLGQSIAMTMAVRKI